MVLRRTFGVKSLNRASPRERGGHCARKCKDVRLGIATLMDSLFQRTMLVIDPQQTSSPNMPTLRHLEAVTRCGFLAFSSEASKL